MSLLHIRSRPTNSSANDDLTICTHTHTHTQQDARTGSFLNSKSTHFFWYDTSHCVLCCIQNGLETVISQLTLVPESVHLEWNHDTSHAVIITSSSTHRLWQVTGHQCQVPGHAHRLGVASGGSGACVYNWTHVCWLSTIS